MRCVFLVIHWFILITLFIDRLCVIMLHYTHIYLTLLDCRWCQSQISKMEINCNWFCDSQHFTFHWKLLVELFILVMKRGVDLELRLESSLLYFKHCKEPNWLLLTQHFPRKKLISSWMWSIFSATCICYDERQAPIVCRVHLVIFSTSLQWKSIKFTFFIIYIQKGGWLLYL